jgi:bifunctional DNA-binding transcriptional regulator/antitoxin component of YhaV-PrlF toxin-antitoxin module
MDARGQLSLPEEVREALNVENGHGLQLDLEVVGETIVLRPKMVIPEEDLWAYTPEHMALLKRALAEPPENDIRLTHAELERLLLGAAE